MQLQQELKGVKIAASVVRVMWCFPPLYILLKYHNGTK